MERKCLDVGDSAVAGDDMIRCCPVNQEEMSFRQSVLGSCQAVEKAKIESTVVLICPD